MQKDLDRALQDAKAWLYLDGVEAIGKGEYEGEACIVVITTRDPEEFIGIIPDEFQGFKVIIERANNS